MPDLLTRTRRRSVTSRHSRTDAIVASAAILRPHSNLRIQNLEWQRELWDFYETMDEFRFAMLWRSQTMSRVRLAAAVIPPGGEEPEIIDSGPAADLMRDFFGGTTGQSRYLGEIDTQLGVPGEGYVVAYDDENGDRHWAVKSSEEIRPTSGRVNVMGQSKTVDLWEIEVDEGAWMKLPFETLVFRQWRSSRRKSFRADSPAKASLNTMRVVRMLDRRVIAQAVSRLASNGLLLYPQEVTFPPKPGFEKAVDPFTAEWLDIAGKVINDPGSALAAIPLPMKVPKEYIESFKHMDFANSYDERLMELIREYRDRLAGGLNVPKEVVTGMGDTSHWNAWTLDEQGIKVHVAPDVELYCGGVTNAYLIPGLRAMGESTEQDGGRIVCWYDTSELNTPPNRAESAEQAYDKFAITTDAYLREKGLDTADKPSPKELREQILLKMASDPTSAPAAIEALELPGPPVAGATTGPGGVDAESPTDQPTPATGPPDQPTPEDNQASGGRTP